MMLRNIDEGVVVALDSLRVNKLRSALTMLGVVIGVSTVMAMASIGRKSKNRVRSDWVASETMLPRRSPGTRPWM